MVTASESTQLRVGELAARTGVSPRLLRYYEQRGLISCTRSASGQRLFDPSAARVVDYVRRLLAAGLTTAVIKELLGCIHDDDRIEPCAVPLLLEHLQAYDARIAGLSETRAALAGLIEASTTADDHAK